MNILMVSHDLTVTGAPNSLLRQAVYFRDAGHNVDIWALGDGALKYEYIKNGFHPIIIDNHFRDITNAWHNRKHNYDFIICNTTETYKVVDFLQRQRTPVVWFIRETKLVDLGMKKDPDFRKVFSNFYNIYTVSDYAADVCSKYNPSVRVINNAVADKFTKFKKTDKKIVFGYIGSIIPVKGLDILLKSFTKLAKNNKNIELHIAGKYHNQFGTELQKYNIPQIKWLGEIQGTDKQKFFDSIDILVVPSLDEPSGLTVIEGAMYGKPVITTDKTGANYLVNDGVSGFVTKAGDTDDLYNSMSKIIKMNLDNMKKQSRKMYLEYGTTDRERADVLKMLDDNKNALPVVKNKPLDKRKFKIFHKERFSNGRRDIYFCGIKIFSYQRKLFNNLYYKKFNDLAYDIKRNIDKIPNDIDLIVGVPRSGIIPAYMLGLFLNKQVCSLPEFLSGMFGENGMTRKINIAKNIKRVLIVDDTVNSGGSIQKVKERVADLSNKYEIKYMAVYGTNQGAYDHVDIVLNILPQPRMFQWNYLNHVFLSAAAFDIDGVLCVDPTPEENDDGEKYEHFILNAKPLYIPKYKVGAIVTSRLAKYRPQTEKWLHDHGIEYDELYMLENMTAEERRRRGVHAKHKAKIYSEHKELAFFIESDINQAKEIAKLTNKRVFCATNDTLY